MDNAVRKLRHGASNRIERVECMELTVGGMMFYGGIAGAALTLVASVIAAAVLGAGRKRIVKRLNDEYGGSIR